MPRILVPQNAGRQRRGGGDHPRWVAAERHTRKKNCSFDAGREISAKVAFSFASNCDSIQWAPCIQLCMWCTVFQKRFGVQVKIECCILRLYICLDLHFASRTAYSEPCSEAQINSRRKHIVTYDEISTKHKKMLKISNANKR